MKNIVTMSHDMYVRIISCFMLDDNVDVNDVVYKLSKVRDY